MGTGREQQPTAAASQAIYHRLESPTQTVSDARKQQESGELWGRIPFGGDRPAAQAYTGRLPSGRRGIEFTATTPPDPGSPPGRVRWSGPRPGVALEEGYAKINITVLLNTQDPA